MDDETRANRFLFDVQPHLEGQTHADWLVRLIRNEIKRATEIQERKNEEILSREKRSRFFGAIALCLSLILSGFAVYDRVKEGVFMSDTIGVQSEALSEDDP